MSIRVTQRFAGYSPPPQCQLSPGGGGGGGADGGQPASAVCGPSTSTRVDSTTVVGARPTVRFSQPVLSTINEMCSQVTSACYQPTAVPPQTTAVKPRRQLRERGNTAADISLHFGPMSSPERQLSSPPAGVSKAVIRGRRRVTVVGAPLPATRQRPTRASIVDARYPAAATTATVELVNQTLTSTTSRNAMTPVG